MKSNLYIVLCMIFNFILSQCDDNMSMFDCDGLEFCNNEATYGFDCYVNNEFCEDFNQDGIVDSWVGDGWCDDGEWGFDFQCEEYSFDCGDCGDAFEDIYGYCHHIPQSFNFIHNGQNRQYYLYEPESIQENAPLIFVLHGYSGSASGIISYAGMNMLADDYGFAVCYPNGTIDQSNNRFWNVGYAFHQNQTVDDVGFLSSLANYLQSENGYSSENTFVTGMSNGGDMSYMLACQADETFKAIAPVAGCMMEDIYNICNPNPIPVFEIHGTADGVTLWNGDMENNDGWGSYLSTLNGIAFWVEQNECQNSEEIQGPALNAIHHRYFDCIDNTEVWLYEIVDGGHDWPTYSSQEIWNFFNQFITSGDINNDGAINIQDIIVLINIVLESNFDSNADINNDGIINILDIIQLVNIILN